MKEIKNYKIGLSIFFGGLVLIIHTLLIMIITL